MSLPTGERGLKYLLLIGNFLYVFKSLPTGERGLKFGMWRIAMNNLKVAPHGGAWIEIIWMDLQRLRIQKSLPTGERGLKFFYYIC